MSNTPLTALFINCTLKPSPAESSTDKLSNELMAELEKHNVTSIMMRMADYNVKPGVETDMGDGDAWPKFRQAMLDADILIVATPIWMGHVSSFAQRVMERLDAELSEMDDQGRMLTYGKVGGVVVVGNEDGAHHVSAEIFQGLNDVGFSLPAGAVTYWNGEAMHKTDYKDLKETPEKVASTTASMALHTAHLARLLKADTYPPAQ